MNTDHGPIPTNRALGQKMLSSLPSGKHLGIDGLELLVEDAVRAGENPVGHLIDTVRRLGNFEWFSDDATVLEVTVR